MKIDAAMHRMVLMPEQDGNPIIVVPVRNGDYVIGRSSRCDIVVSDESVSRRHARLTINGTELLIADLKSRYGTFVDGQSVDSSRIRVGQVIRFGSAPYQLALSSNGEVADVFDGDDVETHKRPANENLAAIELLRPSQRRVFDLMRVGASEPEIAARLNLSVHTVHTHAKAIYSRFNVHSRAELLAQCLRSNKVEGT